MEVWKTTSETIPRSSASSLVVCTQYLFYLHLLEKMTVSHVVFLHAILCLLAPWAGHFPQRCDFLACCTLWVQNCSGHSLWRLNHTWEHCNSVCALLRVLLLCLTSHRSCVRRFLEISLLPENWFSAHVGKGFGRDSKRETEHERDRQNREREWEPEKWKDRKAGDRKQVLGAMCPSPCEWAQC